MTEMRTTARPTPALCAGCVHPTRQAGADLLALAETLLRLSVFLLHRRQPLVLRPPCCSPLAPAPGGCLGILCGRHLRRRICL